jgi:ferritin-like metal-binding protein YciE
VNQLKEAYNAEKSIYKFLQSLTYKINSDDLQSVKTKLINFCTLNHKNLGDAFKYLDIKTFSKKPKVIDEIIQECKMLLKWNTSSAVIDAIIMLTFKKMIHILISMYSSLKNMSRQLEFYEINHLIIENLDRNNYIDSVVNSLALQINKIADTAPEVIEERIKN